jgi:hypothetical protein
MVFLITFMTCDYLLSKASPLDIEFWTCQIDGVKECCLLCHIWANEFVGKLTRFPVPFVWHVFFTEYVYNNIIISTPFPGKNVKGAWSQYRQLLC